jgi:hypothetical protein
MISSNDKLDRAFDDLQRLARKLGLRLDDVRAEHEARVQGLTDQWRSIAPKSEAAVFEFEFVADRSNLQSLLRRVGGHPTDYGVVVARMTLGLDWLGFFCVKNDLLARAFKATLRSCRVVENPLNGVFPPTLPDSPKSEDPPIGVAYKPDSGLSIDDWSMAVFVSFADLPVVAGGEWTRWEPGYLVLEVRYHDGRAIDPIIVDTANEELTVSFGFWETHLPGPDYLTGEYDSEASVLRANGLIEDWLSGHMSTAVYFSSDDKWCGTFAVDSSGLIEELSNGAERVKGFSPTRIELRAPERANWRFFQVLAGGSIEEVPKRNRP